VLGAGVGEADGVGAGWEGAVLGVGLGAGAGAVEGVGLGLPGSVAVPVVIGAGRAGGVLRERDVTGAGVAGFVVAPDVVVAVEDVGAAVPVFVAGAVDFEPEELDEDC
jgi:hypothetical protein